MMKSRLADIAKELRKRSIAFFDRWSKFLIIVLVILFSLIIIQDAYVQPPSPPPPPTYSLTAHGNSTSGVNRNVVPTVGPSYPADGAYSTGHCGHCHEMHASIGGNEPPPTGDFENPYSLFKENYGTDYRNELCYACHETFNFTGTPDPPLGYGRYYCYSGKTNYAGPTNNSTHNTSGSMTWPLTPPPGPTYLDPGNCDNCHNPHGYRDATGVIPSMLFKREETLCNECHDGSPALKDIKTRVTTDTYRHNVGGYSGVHRAGNQETSAYISANKHVECVDCHNPHMAKGGLHTASTNYRTANGNLVSNSGMLTGVLGAVATFATTTNWPASTSISYSLNIATKEYEICFKCHAYYNTNVESWGTSPPSGAQAWTDVGREFNPGNQSYHPIAQALPATDPSITYGSSTLASSQLAGGWAPGDTMYCSDCHNTDSTTSSGPHGSAVKWMLAGTNKAWPFTSAASNGASSGTYRTLSNITSGTDNGLFCMNCHPNPTSSNSNNVHNNNFHSNYACVRCHIRVPHGGKSSRLMADYGSTPMPSRYYPDGNGGGYTTGIIGIIKRARTSYNQSDCYTNCGKHSNTEHSGSYSGW